MKRVALVIAVAGCGGGTGGTVAPAQWFAKDAVHYLDHVQLETRTKAIAATGDRGAVTVAYGPFAARAGLDGARYEWGDDKPPPGSPRANSWQGVVPAVDTGDDGYKARTAPVGCYPASAWGLFDMTGNVWEWTKDWFGDPAAPDASHLIKGGSFLCADNFCYRYRPSARQPGPPDTGSSHVGFRTVKRG